MTHSSSIDTAYWRRIGALLEAGLALPPEERRRWLDTLALEDACHRAFLAHMLARASLESDPFMGSPVGVHILEEATQSLATALRRHRGRPR